MRELRVNPIEGRFDTKHLKTIHAYIFQDLPHHKPGITRSDAPNWTKHRELEASRGFHDVPYVSRDVEGRITRVLKQFGGPAAITGLKPNAAARRLAELYGDLDHAHGFYEGNSRTLREFTRELAAAAGFKLDWIRTGITATERNELYLARDLAVYEREYPGLTEQKAMQTNDRREYEVYFIVERLRQTVGKRTLEARISSTFTARPARQQASRDCWIFST